MIPMQHNEKITALAGQLPTQTKLRTPFNALACDFLNALSKSLLSNAEAKKEADVAAFAFWCRKSHLQQLKQRFEEPHIRIGRGLVFHITPSNVPVNFAYSFAFGLLSGNANILRLPSKSSKSLDFLVDAINGLFKDNKYIALAETNTLVRYERNAELTDAFSKSADARIIWGGDATIAEIRKSPIRPRTVEIAFADRYSFCVMSESSISALADGPLQALAQGFYNDAYLMDQNACSSPHLIVWLNVDGGKGRARFWAAVKKIATKNMVLKPVEAVDKYTRLLSNFIEGPEGQHRIDADEHVTRIRMAKLPNDIDKMRGIFGLFYEFETGNISDVAHIVNSKYQTLTYFGLAPLALGNFVVQNCLSGIDRIVPVGSALAMDTIWDGVDVLKQLSRIIDVR